MDSGKNAGSALKYVFFAESESPPPQTSSRRMIGGLIGTASTQSHIVYQSCRKEEISNRLSRG